jgi:hypothetical protein
MPTSLVLTKRLRYIGGIAVLLILGGCAVPQQIAAVPVGPIPPGQARIWFYRVYDPSLSLNIANVDLNGARAVSVSPHSPPVYRDIAPGRYHIAPETYGVDVHQSRDVDIAAGQEIYIKVLDNPAWASGGGVSDDFQRDTFYVWLMPPQLAKAEWRCRYRWSTLEVFEAQHLVVVVVGEDLGVPAPID